MLSSPNEENGVILQSESFSRSSVEVEKEEVEVEDTSSQSGIDHRALEDIEKGGAETKTSGQPHAEFQRPLSSWQWFLVCVGILSCAILYGLDTTIAADVQGPILQSLGEIEKLAWVGIGFPMGSVAVILLVGWFYGLFEVKYLMIASFIIFEAGSALCGAAPTMNALIVGRVIAGIGGAGMYLGALTYMSVLTSVRERPIYNGLIGLFWGAGAILGPLVGGAFSDSSATWRWAFYINLPIAALVAPVFIFLFPKHNPSPSVPGLRKLSQIDWVGAFLNAAIFILFQVVLTFSGSTWKWDSAGSITLWIILGISIILFAIQQTFAIFTTPERRLFPIQFLKSRSMVLLFIGTATATTGLSIGVYYIPIFFQFTKGDSAIKAAVRLLPFVTVSIFFIMASGAILPVYGRYSPFYIGTGVFLIIGGALMHTVDENTATGAIYGYEVLMAIGTGISGQIGYSVSVVLCKPHEVPSALGFMNVAQIGVIAIALSIAGSIFQNLGYNNLRDALSAYHFSESELRAALGGAKSAILVGGDDMVRKLATDAIVATVSKLWIMIIAAGAVSLVCGILMRPEKLELEHTAGG